ncbi:conjugative transfer protein MobI(A/C) [Aquipseudomonas alcaligenes]|uniref:Uncharacterized protein n=1 Tax=Aquipseudomonas alcaligenes TaxID=43263 RepID=A0A1N6XFS3_AQUAC|nr:conjugative transfer protein MobI(A/C) [Pseudomonas alcaligenes]SIR01143.1 hypothetical protein SAMN05878282_112129 [Pseudomonas alcaligenes]
MTVQNALSGLITQIDAAYDQLTKQAEMLRDAFFNDAKQNLAEGRMHVPIVITVTKIRGTYTSISWARMVAKKRNSNSKTMPFPRKISKGTGRGSKSFSYPATCFTFLDPEMRHLVLQYEKVLTLVREEANRLLQLRKDTIQLIEMDALTEELCAKLTSNLSLSGRA